MKKKLKRKLKREYKYWDLEVDGNNGGDIIRIHDNKDGTLHIWNGSCCVLGMNMIVPVEFLTGLIQKSLIEQGGVKGVIEQFNWDREFKDTLIKKVRTYHESDN